MGPIPQDFIAYEQTLVIADPASVQPYRVMDREAIGMAQVLKVAGSPFGLTPNGSFST